MGLKTAKVKVHANITRWQWSGITVNEGDLVSIKATADAEGFPMEWSIGFGYPCNAIGHDYTVDATIRPIYFRNSVGNNFHWGSLLVSIGNTEAELFDDDHATNPGNPERMFEVGLNKTFIAQYTGKLCFLCNGKSLAGGGLPNRPDADKGFNKHAKYLGAEVTVNLPD